MSGADSVSQQNFTPVSRLDEEIARQLKRDENGLVCAVVQDHVSGQVLMVGWMNDEALARTLRGDRVTFWSRSRQEYWRKGDTSGNTQHLKEVFIDCDGDALLLKVEQVGPACHTGTRSCFEAGGLLPHDGGSCGVEDGADSIGGGGNK